LCLGTSPEFTSADQQVEDRSDPPDEGHHDPDQLLQAGQVGAAKDVDQAEDECDGVEKDRQQDLDENPSSPNSSRRWSPLAHHPKHIRGLTVLSTECGRLMTMIGMSKRIKKRTWRLLTERSCPSCGRPIESARVLRAGRWYCSDTCAAAAAGPSS
jgi:ribosomal protein L37AE/L43A